MILTADDFGLNHQVNNAIIDLVKIQRLAAVSCFAVTPAAAQGLRDLQRLNADIDVGLHFCLTEEKPFKNFSQVLKAAYKKQINPLLVEAELRAQLDFFKLHFGRAPDYIDGHHHVQQLPGVREIVARVAKNNSSIKYVRAAALPLRWLLKEGFRGFPYIAASNIPIALLGQRFRKYLSHYKIASNRYLLGYYNHNKPISFKQVFKYYSNLKPQTNDIFFCHPGWDTPVRQDNFAFLASDEFLEELNVHALKINRYTPKN